MIFLIILMTETWSFCKLDIFSGTISSGRTYFAIWDGFYPVSRIISGSWVDQFLNMIGYLGEFFQDLFGIPIESHWNCQGIQM